MNIGDFIRDQVFLIPDDLNQVINDGVGIFPQSGRYVIALSSLDINYLQSISYVKDFINEGEALHFNSIEINIL